MRHQKILNCFSKIKGLHKMGPVKLPSGNVCPINVDFVSVFSDPKHLKIIGQALAKEIKRMDVSLIAGIATAGIPLAVSASHWSGLPFVYIRRKPDSRTGEIIQGKYRKGQRAVLIDDIIGAGNTKKLALKNIKNKIIVKNILVLISIDETYKPNWRFWVESRDIRLKYLLDWTELTRHLIKKGSLDKKAGYFLLKYLKDQKWHQNRKLWQQYSEWRKYSGFKTGDPII